jgi:hypothetical protein
MALAGTPFKLRVLQGSSNPLAFFQGNTSPGDVLAGLPIERGLKVNEKELSFSQFCHGIVSSVQPLAYQLRAATGEGKTTFLLQLSLALEAAGALVIWWDDIRTFQLAALTDLARMIGRPPVLLLELDRRNPIEDVRYVASRLNEAAAACTIVVAGAPTELQFLAGLRANVLRFAPLQTTSINSLIDKLSTLAAVEQPLLESVMPNIVTFLNDPQPGYFEDVPLMVGLLRATYGQDFHRRLADEYHSLSLDARDLYRLVCYFDAVQEPLSTDFAIEFLANDDVARSLTEAGPWVVSGKSSKVMRSRHPVIAQTVLSECGLLSRPFHQFLEAIFETANQDFDAGMVRNLAFNYARWLEVKIEPPTDDESSIGGQLRGAIRKVFKSNAAWFKESRMELALRSMTDENAWQQAFEWSATLHELLPFKKGNQATSATDFLCEEMIAWLDVARSSCPQDRLPRYRYLEIKAELQPVWHDAKAFEKLATDRLEEWVSLSRKPSIGLDCHADLATVASRLLESTRDPTKQMHLGQLIIGAYEVLIAAPACPDIRTIRYLHEKVLNQLLRTWPVRDSFRFDEVLRTGWQMSVAQGRPNAFTGTWFAQRLYEAKQFDEAKAVLLKILAHTAWGDALLTLARNDNDVGTLERIEHYVNDHYAEESGRNFMDLALAFHALALAQKNTGRTSCERFNLACQYYEKALTLTPGLWKPRGAIDWNDALSALEGAGCSGSQLRRAEWMRLRPAQ